MDLLNGNQAELQWQGPHLAKESYWPNFGAIFRKEAECWSDDRSLESRGGAACDRHPDSGGEDLFWYDWDAKRAGTDKTLLD